MARVYQHSSRSNLLLSHHQPALVLIYLAAALASELTTADFCTDLLGRSLRYSMSAARWKAVAQSWLTHVTCRLVEIFHFVNSVCEGRAGPFGTDS